MASQHTSSRTPDFKLKMSLMAQYDDLWRKTTVLTSAPEGEFKAFVENQLMFVKKLKENECEVKKLNEKVSSLHSRNRCLETQIQHLKNLVQESLKARKKMELEKNSLERQITLIKEVLLADNVMDDQTKEKLGFLSLQKTISSPRLDTIEEISGSLLSITDFTEDDIDPTRHSSACQPNEKRSNPENRIPIKKAKFESDEESETDSCESNFLHKPFATRSSSEPSNSSPERPILPHPVHKSDSVPIKNQPYEFRRCNTGGFYRSTPIRSSCGKLTKTHSFVVKILFRPEKCPSCESSIGFMKQSLKCQDCRIICHPECKDQCPMPCIPRVNTPIKDKNGTISDYVSSPSPMIPPLIVYCVNEIEARGLRVLGLYRIPGRERDVKALKEKILIGHCMPCLNQVDVHVLCGTIKEFLRSLKEPLITHSSWQEFVNAADLPDNNQRLKAIYDIVADFPEPNRDTLSFLILHLQRVAESPDCKMPISSLAKMLGPTIVGNSMPEPADVNVFHELGYQCKIMELLLSVPVNSWKTLLNAELDVFVNNGTAIPVSNERATPSKKITTPEALPIPKPTRLGPIYAPGKSPIYSPIRKSKNSANSPVTSRMSRKYNTPGIKSSSPHLK